MFDIISGLVQAIMFFFGIYEEDRVTQELCQQIWESGYVTYPMSDEDFKRIEQCNELMRGERG